MNERADMFVDTLEAAVANLAVILGPILAAGAICLVVREILKHIWSST
ncbi:hypothetical protein ROS217_02345 [Roseovarius sp. 217]|nr:hypothetical protein ROS217_02345 [Roseovarius sp. 217]